MLNIRYAKQIQSNKATYTLVMTAIIWHHMLYVYLYV